MKIQSVPHTRDTVKKTIQLMLRWEIVGVSFFWETHKTYYIMWAKRIIFKVKSVVENNYNVLKD
jgi:hypothetical protein